MAVVRDVMQTDVLSLWIDQSVSNAASVFAENEISGAPVCDVDGRVVGMLSKTDLAEHIARESDPDLRIEDVMTREVISVGADEPLERAISIMAFEGVHRLVVLDGQSHIAGIISSMDVLRELAGFGRTATRRAIAAPSREPAATERRR